MTVTERARPRIAGVELGGTKCVLLLAEGPDRVLAQERIPTRDPAATLADIVHMLDRWWKVPGFDALGIASFGPLALGRDDFDFGTIVATPKAGWTGTRLLQEIGDRYAVPVAIETDVNAAALAEGRWGAAQGLSSHHYLTCGTGVGVGIVSGGRPLRGFAHAEAGHLRSGRAAGDPFAGICPFHGDCAEGLVSGPALAARFGCSADKVPADAPEWRFVISDIAALLHNLLLALMPERIALGGGVLGGRPWLFGPVREGLAELLAGYGTMSEWAADVERRVGPPALGHMAGPLGAIALGEDALTGQISVAPCV